MEIKSPAFGNNSLIPSKYTCDGENISPELNFSQIPEGTKSLALIMDDPDIPDFVKEERGIEVFDHWVVFNMPADISGIKEAQVPAGIVGLNSKGTNEYLGSCPPDREHRYFFKLFALDTSLDLDRSTMKARLLKAMEGHVLAEAQLMGRYERQ